MDAQTLTNILNELLAAEQYSLTQRLVESTVFVSELSVEGAAALEQMAKASEEHGAWLAGAIGEFGGIVGIPVHDPASADLHFQDLHRALPRLGADRESLIHKYTLASERVNREPRAAQLVARIMERHREELATLKRLRNRSVGTAG